MSVDHLRASTHKSNDLQIYFTHKYKYQKLSYTARPLIQNGQRYFRHIAKSERMEQRDSAKSDSKQHYLVDVYGGWSVGKLSRHLYLRLQNERQQRRQVFHSVSCNGGPLGFFDLCVLWYRPKYDAGNI